MMAKRIFVRLTREKGRRHWIAKITTNQIGDIIVLREDGIACCLWKLAKVLELFKGREKMIRSARVQVLSKDKIIYLRRPIKHLVPLEADQI